MVMPMDRLVALRDVPVEVATHPLWVWEEDQWVIVWPELNFRISERRLRILLMRWVLISMSLRRAKPGQGSLADSSKSEGIMSSNWENLFNLSSRRFAVCGGWAVNYYARPRYTQDLDIVILIQDIERWDAFLQDQGWHRTGQLSIGGWTYTNGTLELDVLAINDSWVSQAINEAQNNVRDGIPILPLPWLVLMKLNAGRTGDQADISRMLGTLSLAEFQQVIQILAPWTSAEDREDLDALYQLGQLEIQSE